MTIHLPFFFVFSIFVTLIYADPAHLNDDNDGWEPHEELLWEPHEELLNVEGQIGAQEWQPLNFLGNSIDDDGWDSNLHLVSDDDFEYQELLLNANRQPTARHVNREGRQSALQYTKALTQEDKDAIVKCHNDHRSDLALGKVFNKGRRGNKMPKASRMYKIRWDDKLAEFAAEWANKCIYDHSPAGYADGAGECLAMSDATYTTEENLLEACNSWWNELHKVGFYDKELKLQKMPYVEFVKIGHWIQGGRVFPPFFPKWTRPRRDLMALLFLLFTQMAWQNTVAIGCAVTHHCTNNLSTWYNNVVCEYHVAGNVLGEQIYETGKPCSKCGSAKCDKAKGLCYN